MWSEPPHLSDQDQTLCGGTASIHYPGSVLTRVDRRSEGTCVVVVYPRRGEWGKQRDQSNDPDHDGLFTEGWVGALS